MRRLQIFLSLILVTTCFGQLGNVNLGPLPGMQFTNRTHRLGRGLVAYWPMNARSGTTAFDLSGNGNDGTITGAVWVPGKSGPALSFDGGDYISANSGIPDGYVPYTIITWVYLNDLSADYALWQWNTGAQNHLLWMDFEGTNEGYRLLAYNAGSTSEDTGGAIANQWQMITVTYDGSTFTLYTDALFSDSFVQSGLPEKTPTIEFGWQSSGSKELSGLLSNILIYNRALSAGEIAELYKERDSWMFKRGDIELMAKSVVAPPAPGGQFIMINMAMIPLIAIPLVLITSFCLMMGRKNA